MSGEKIYRKPDRSDTYGEKGNSRSRTLGVFVLMMALFIFQVTIYIYEKFSQREETALAAKGLEHDYDVSDSISGSSPGEPGKLGDPGKPGSYSPFFFDPNTITLDSLCMLGLSPRQARTILNYRNKGGRFRQPEDFARMYVVSEEFYLRVKPFIVIAPEVAVGKHSTYSSRANRKSDKKQKPDTVRCEKSRNIVTERDFDTAHHSAVSKNIRARQTVVELNGADSAALVKLYGIGPFYAKKIMAYRKRLGGFHSALQLMDIGGIDSTRFAGMQRNIVVDPLKIRRFRLDTAGKSFLIAHPYIGAYAARGILLLRQKLGDGACTLENLVKERIISKEKAELLWPYIE